MNTQKLSISEQIALEYLAQNGGCILVTDVPDVNGHDLFGEVIPGLKVFKKLEKKGLVFFTEEEQVIFEDGFVYDPTPLIYLTGDIDVRT
jgi:hypothetical protein